MQSVSSILGSSFLSSTKTTLSFSTRLLTPYCLLFYRSCVTPHSRWCEYIFVLYDLSSNPEKAEESITQWVSYARSSPNLTTRIAILGTKSDIADSKTREEVARVALQLELPHFFVSSQTPAAWDQLLYNCADEMAIAERLGLPPDYYITGPGFDHDEKEDEAELLLPVRLVPSAQPSQTV